ncbi:MAG: transporter [Bacteroidota bacterium]
MSDLEFDILDELYFVIPFEQLLKALPMDEKALKEALHSLIEKGWVKCFLADSTELSKEELNLENDYRHYQYLATKAGLFAHNSL